jgi:predicted RNA-binding protein with PIN domain
MFVFVDAYNVLKTMKGIDYVLPQESEYFIACAQQRALNRGYQVVVVFDAGEGKRPTIYHRPHATIIYSGLQQSADDMLIQVIEQSSGHENFLVTADRSLRKRGIICGAQPIDPITYWRVIHEDEEDDTACNIPSIQEVPLDFKKEYSIEDLKALAFSQVPRVKSEESLNISKHLSHKKSKAIKKFEKIKGRL